jgi:hypothetical protein
MHFVGLLRNSISEQAQESASGSEISKLLKKRGRNDEKSKVDAALIALAAEVAALEETIECIDSKILDMEVINSKDQDEKDKLKALYAKVGRLRDKESKLRDTSNILLKKSLEISKSNNHSINVCRFLFPQLLRVWQWKFRGRFKLCQDTSWL